MIGLRKRVRTGFTLVEMLVVIVIISILAALITAAAASALWSAKQTKIKVEVDMLAGAMESFKQKYNSYPPANLTCPSDGNMPPNYIANPQLVAFVARAFPRYAPVSAPSLAAQIGYDLTNAGVDVSEFNPQVALVFWLSGFSPDPTDPFNRNNITTSRSPFFSFNQTQLLAWTPAASATGSLVPAVPSSTGTLYIPNPTAPGTIAASTVPSYGIGQMVYNAPYGNAAYCYFDLSSYGALNNTVGGTWPVGQAAPNNLTNGPGVVYANSGASGSLPIEDINGLLVTLGLYNGTGNVMPYIFDVNNSGTLNVGDTFCKPSSFQIISAGQDGSFGQITTPSNGRLYPTGYNYDAPPPAGGSGDDDNVTNFCEKNALESAKP
jgi:prepilin-type N-terminal cleavage/methylation domain-containing protein